MPTADPGAPAPRILILIKGLGIGGAERLVSEGSKYWSTDEFDYRVAYILPWKDQLVSDLAATQIQTTCIGGGRWSLGAQIRLSRLIGSWRPALIHAHLPAAGILARLVASVPVIYTEHNLAGSYRPATRLLNRLTYGRNQEVIAVSDAVAASLAGYPGPAPHIIPNGVVVEVSGETRSRVRNELGIEPDRPLAVHVGNIRPWKGHTTLIQAARLLGASNPDLVIVSIGAEKHAGDLDRLRRQADAEGAGNLRFLGRRPDAVDFIASADVFVNPSDVEGLPLVVLEAMMVGTPVVATAAGGVGTVVREGDTGRLVPVGEPEALAAAVRDTLSDTDGAKEMADRAQDLVEAGFSLERMVEDHEALYRQVLSG